MHNYVISYTSILYNFHFAIAMLLTFNSSFLYSAGHWLESIVIVFTSFNSHLNLS